MGIKVGSFTKATGTGGETNTIGGLGFAPSSIILFCTKATTDNSVENSDSSQCHGASDGTNSRCVWLGMQDNVGTSVTRSGQHDDSVIVLYDPSDGTLNVKGTIVFSPDFYDEFRITWGTNDTNAYIIKYIVTSLAAEVNGFAVDTSVGSQTVSTTGVGKAIMFFTRGSDSSSQNTVVTTAQTWGGFAQSSTKESGISYLDRHNLTTTLTKNRVTNDSCAIALAWDGSINREFDFTSFNSSPNGFTINHSAVTATASIVFYIMFTEGTFDLGVSTAPTTATTKSFTTTFQPDAIILYSICRQTLDSTGSNFGPCFGATDCTNNAAAVSSSRSGVATTAINQAAYNNACLVNTNNDTELQRASYSSRTSSSFTLDWAVADGTARYFTWLAIQDTATANPKGPLGLPLHGVFGGPI